MDLMKFRTDLTLPKVRAGDWVGPELQCIATLWYLATREQAQTGGGISVNDAEKAVEWWNARAARLLT